MILIFCFRSYSTVDVCSCCAFLVMFKRLMFVSVIVSVRYKFFSHIHSVMRNRSNDWSSSKLIIVFFEAYKNNFTFNSNWRIFKQIWFLGAAFFLQKISFKNEALLPRYTLKGVPLKVHQHSKNCEKKKKRKI